MEVQKALSLLFIVATVSAYRAQRGSIGPGGLKGAVYDWDIVRVFGKKIKEL